MFDATENFVQTIEAEMGFRPTVMIVPDRMYRFSTSQKCSHTAGWCKLFSDGRAGVYGDHRTGLSGIWISKFNSVPTLAQRQQRADELKASRAEAATMQSARWALAATKNVELWAHSNPVKPGDSVNRYLEGRGLRVDSLPEALRYHAHLAYFDGNKFMGYHPAMLGAVTDKAGQLVSVHRTYLTLDGHKANLPTVKKLTGCSAPLAGCSVKLYPPALFKGLTSIGIAEGIETALACIWATGTPTVSAVSAQGLARYQWPQEVRNLIIFADNDMSQVGQRAAEMLAKRVRKAGLAEQVLVPTEPGTDWADVYGACAEVK